MEQTAGGAAPENQHRIEFSNGNWIAFIVLMLVGWFAGLDNDDSNIPIESFYSDRPIIERIVDQEIDVADFRITPTNGWTYLKVSGKEAKRALNFVNEKNYLVAEIQPIHFSQWPPTIYETRLGDDTGDRKEKQLDAQDIESVQYQNIVVEWFSLQRLSFATFHDGRIHTENQDFAIRVMSQRGYTDEQMTAVSRLCDQIIRSP